MSEFSDLLRMILDDPDAFDSKIRTQLDPNLVDQLTAYAASRNVPLPLTVVKALELFMLLECEKGGFRDGQSVARFAPLYYG